MGSFICPFADNRVEQQRLKPASQKTNRLKYRCQLHINLLKIKVDTLWEIVSIFFISFSVFLVVLTNSHHNQMNHLDIHTFPLSLGWLSLIWNLNNWLLLSPTLLVKRCSFFYLILNWNTYTFLIFFIENIIFKFLFSKLLVKYRNDTLKIDQIPILWFHYKLWYNICVIGWN